MRGKHSWRRGICVALALTCWTLCLVLAGLIQTHAAETNTNTLAVVARKLERVEKELQAIKDQENNLKDNGKVQANELNTRMLTLEQELDGIRSDQINLNDRLSDQVSKLQEEFQSVHKQLQITKRRDEKDLLHAAEAAGDEMNYAEKYLEDYGSINISVPLLAQLGEDFNFNLNQGTTNYYNDAKSQVQGEAASLQQKVQSFSLGAQAQIDPTIAAAYAAQLQSYFSSLQRYTTKQNLFDQAAQQELQANLAAANTNTDPTARFAASAQALQTYAQQYTAPSNTPVFPTDSEQNTNLPSPATGLAQRPDLTNVLSSQQFLPFQGLLNGLNVQPTTTDRSAIITAAGDLATESIFRHFMGNTNLSNLPEENIYFGFCTVSVDPGWRTSKGWAAEAVMTAELTYVKPRKGVFTKYINERYARFAEDPGALKFLDKLIKDNGGLTAMDLQLNDPDLQLYPNLRLDPGLALALEENEVAQKIAVGDFTNIVALGQLPVALLNRENYLALTNFTARLCQIKCVADNTIIDATNADKFISSLAASNHLAKYFVSLVANSPMENISNSPDLFSWDVVTDMSVTNPRPVAVTVISPLVDSDVLDLSNSGRSQSEFALALSFALRSAGLGAQADAFEKFVKSNQYDVRTRTPQIAVNAFSSTDGRFGFQVGPRLVALGLDNINKSQPGQVLERQSFPALLILRLGAADLQPKVVNNNGTILMFEPTLTFHQQRRWMPLSHSFFRDYTWFSPTAWVHPPLTEKRRLVAAAKLAIARDELDGADFGHSLNSNSINLAILQRIDHLEAEMIGDEGTIYFNSQAIVPDDEKSSLVPIITNVVPNVVTLDPKGTNNLKLVFFGSGLDAVNIAGGIEALPGNAVISNSFTHAGSALVADITFSNNASGAVMFQLPLKTKGDFILTLPIQLNSTKTNSPSSGGPVPTFAFSHVTGNTVLTNTFVGSNIVIIKTITNVPILLGFTTSAPAPYYSIPTNLDGVLTSNILGTNFTITANYNPSLSSTNYETNVSVLNIVVTNSVGLISNENFSITISTNATDSQVNAASVIVRTALEKDKPADGQSSNNVLSILVNQKPPIAATTTNSVTATVISPSGK